MLRALVRFGTPELAPASPDRAPRAGHRRPPRLPVVVRRGRGGPGRRRRALRRGGRRAGAAPLVRGGPRPAAASTTTAAVTVAGPAWAFTRLRQGSTLDELATDGSLQVTGSRAARTRFRRALRPDLGALRRLLGGDHQAAGGTSSARRGRRRGRPRRRPAGPTATAAPTSGSPATWASAATVAAVEGDGGRTERAAPRAPAGPHGDGLALAGVGVDVAPLLGRDVVVPAVGDEHVEHLVDAVDRQVGVDGRGGAARRPRRRAGGPRSPAPCGGTRTPTVWSGGHQL